MNSSPPQRILLKLSGETLMGSEPFGIQQDACHTLALSLAELQKQNLQIALVIGGGNIFRGIKITGKGLPRVPADYMGMLATMINGIALQEALRSIGCDAIAMSALECPKAITPYDLRKAQNFLQEGKLLIFSGGTGNPFFTTDTAAALRACEIGAHVLWKATNVDGVYPADPRTHPGLEKYSQISYSEVLAQKLQVMDATAVILCRDNGIPIDVFNKALLRDRQFLSKMAQSTLGTRIAGD
ncbi:MAG: UMP kinase [Parachlamydiales bacterium]|jgi:uridylate kinase